MDNGQVDVIPQTEFGNKWPVKQQNPNQSNANPRAKRPVARSRVHGGVYSVS
jgi:hypothetical protein